jgi:hypothetical protein
MFGQRICLVSLARGRSQAKVEPDDVTSSSTIKFQKNYFFFLVALLFFAVFVAICNI